MATTLRFISGANQNNTLSAARRDAQSLAYAAAIALNIADVDQTLIQIADLTGALALSANVGSATSAPYVGDKLQVLFKSTGGATVTFGAGFSVSAATQVIPATKKATIEFLFDGATWVEIARTVTV